MATPKKRSVKKEVEKERECTVTLTLGDMTYSGAGATMLEAVRAIPKPLKIVHKGVLHVSAPEGKRMMTMTIPQSKRLFYPSAQYVIAKQLSYGLK